MKSGSTVFIQCRKILTWLTLERKTIAENIDFAVLGIFLKLICSSGILRYVYTQNASLIYKTQGIGFAKLKINMCVCMQVCMCVCVSVSAYSNKSYKVQDSLVNWE